MSVLRVELEKAKKSIPFVYEIYPKDKRDGLQEFLDENEDQDSIVISYDANDKALFLAYWIDEIYKHYNMEAPDKIKQYRKLGMNFTKVGMFAAGFALSGGASIALSFLGSGITIFEKIKDKIKSEDSKEELAVDALKLFSKEKDNISKPELLILGAIRLLYQLSQIKNIIFHIKNPQNLSTLDTQFIRLYYNLFKDKNSRIQFLKEVEGNSDTSEEAESSILTIFDWIEEDPELYLEESSNKDDNSLMKFRWFLKRYRMVDDLKGDILNQVVAEDTFVGRASILKELIDDFNQVKAEKRCKIRRIQGNSGMGKTTLANQFISKIHSDDSNKNLVILKSSYSGEDVNYRGGLTEIRTAINQLRIRSDKPLRNNIEEMLYSSYVNNIELINWIKERFDSSCELESLISPLMELAGGNLGIAGKILSTISTAGGINDVVGAAKFSVESYILKKKPEINIKEENKDIYEIINDLYLNLINICDKCKDNNTLIWVIDDLQWMDIDSVKFFNKIIKSDYFKNIPIYILFLEREADFSSRLSSSREREVLNELEESLTENTIRLNGFGKEEIKDLLSISIFDNNHNGSKSDLLANKLWDWFVKLDGKQSIEPLFVVESINLLAEQEGDNQIIVLNQSSGKWEWIDQSIEEIDTRMGRILSNWSQGTSDDYKEHGFTPSGIAILEERLYRLKNHFSEDKGYTLINTLEVGAFIGEPFMLNAALTYIEGFKNSSNLEIDFEEIENIYGIVLKYSRYISDEKLLAYLYSHSLYKKYMNLRFKRYIEDLSEAHSKVFKCIDYIIRNQDIQDDIVVDIYGQAVEHAILSNNKENYENALIYALMLTEIYNQKGQPREELVYYQKALKLCEHSGIDYIKNVINHKIARLYYDFGEYDLGLEIIYTTIDKYKDNIGYSLPFKKLEFNFLEAKGDFEKALTIGENLIEIIEEAEGKESEAYKIALDNLAQVMVKLGKVEKAKSIQEELLNWSINQYGENHSKTLIFKDNLANTYNSLGYCNEAISLEKEVYRVAKEVWGEKSKHTINNMVNLAGSLLRIRRYDDVIEISDEAYRLAKSVYGERNPLTLRAMTNLATAYRRLGKLTDSLELGLKVIEIKESLFSKDHLEVITSKNNLARVYIDLGDLESAEMIQKEVANTLKEVYPQNLNDRIVCLTTLQQIYRMQKNYDSAKECSEEIKDLSRSMPDGHINIIRYLLEEVQLYYELDKIQDYIKLCNRIASAIITNKLYMIANFEFDITLKILLPTLHNDRRYSSVIEIGEEIIRDENIIGDHNLLAFVYYYLSFAYLETGSSEKAMIYIEKSLDSLKKTSDIKSIPLADSIYLKGIIQRFNKNYSEALSLCQEAEKIYMEYGEETSYKRYDLLIEISMIHMFSGDWLNAARNQRKVIEMGDLILEEDNKDRVVQRQRIAYYYNHLKNWGRARKVLLEAVNLAEKYHLDDHELVKEVVDAYNYCDEIYKTSKN